jgi:serine/threonine protein kinase
MLAAWKCLMNNREAGDTRIAGENLAEDGKPSPENLVDSRRRTTEQLPIGSVFDDKYLIQEFLGEGGFSQVFKAKHLPLKKTVAIKLLHEKYASDEERRQRFTREARTTSSLCHPNIVALHDFGYSQQKPYLVMDYVEGATLAGLLKQGRQFTTEEYLQIASQACAALTAAHSQGIIHRDLKPENIMLIDSGSEGFLVKLLDFGVAKVVQQDGDSLMAKTRTGEVLGTPSYMSPEQCMGYELDARSDIYSLGCVIYELVTGAKAFSADSSLALMMQHLNDMPRTFADVCPQRHISAAMEAAIFKALAKKREDRFESAGQFWNAILAAATGTGSSLKSHLDLMKSRSAAKLADPYRWLKILVCALPVCMGAAYLVFSLFLQPHWMKLQDEAQNYYFNGDARRAVQAMQQVLKEAEKGGANRHEQAVILGKLGDFTEVPGESAKYYQRSISLLEGTGDEKLLAVVLEKLAGAKNYLHDYKKAKISAEQAAEKTEKAWGGSSAQMRNCLLTCGRVFYNCGEYARAEAAFRRALDIESKLKVKISEYVGFIDWMLCWTSLAQNNLSDAQKWYDECVLDEEKLGDAGNSFLSDVKTKYPEYKKKAPHGLPLM